MFHEEPEDRNDESYIDFPDDKKAALKQNIIEVQALQTAILHQNVIDVNGIYNVVLD